MYNYNQLKKHAAKHLKIKGESKIVIALGLRSMYLCVCNTEGDEVRCDDIPFLMSNLLCVSDIPKEELTDTIDCYKSYATSTMVFEGDFRATEDDYKQTTASYLIGALESCIEDEKLSDGERGVVAKMIVDILDCPRLDSVKANLPDDAIAYFDKIRTLVIPEAEEFVQNIDTFLMSK